MSHRAARLQGLTEPCLPYPLWLNAFIGSWSHFHVVLRVCRQVIPTIVVIIWSCSTWRGEQTVSSYQIIKDLPFLAPPKEDFPSGRGFTSQTMANKQVRGQSRRTPLCLKAGQPSPAGWRDRAHRSCTSHLHHLRSSVPGQASLRCSHVGIPSHRPQRMVPLPRDRNVVTVLCPQGFRCQHRAAVVLLLPTEADGLPSTAQGTNPIQRVSNLWLKAGRQRKGSAASPMPKELGCSHCFCSHPLSRQKGSHPSSASLLCAAHSPTPQDGESSSSPQHCTYCPAGVVLFTVPILQTHWGEPCQLQHEGSTGVRGARVHPEILPAGQDLPLPAAYMGAVRSPWSPRTEGADPRHPQANRNADCPHLPFSGFPGHAKPCLPTPEQPLPRHSLCPASTGPSPTSQCTWGYSSFLPACQGKRNNLSAMEWGESDCAVKQGGGQLKAGGLSPEQRVVCLLSLFWGNQRHWSQGNNVHSLQENRSQRALLGRQQGFSEQSLI